MAKILFSWKSRANFVQCGCVFAQGLESKEVQAYKNYIKVAKKNTNNLNDLKT